MAGWLARFAALLAAACTTTSSVRRPIDQDKLPGLLADDPTGRTVRIYPAAGPALELAGAHFTPGSVSGTLTIDDPRDLPIARRLAGSKAQVLGFDPLFQFGGSSATVPLDALTAISWNNRWQGAGWGALIGLPVGVIGGAMTGLALASSSSCTDTCTTMKNVGAFFGSAIGLVAGPLLGAIIGAGVGHEYRVEFLAPEPSPPIDR
jgi:hypothetical protein